MLDMHDESVISALSWIVFNACESCVCVCVCVCVQLLRVGVTVFRYVTISAAACWLITIDKNIKGRGHRPSDSKVVASTMYFIVSESLSVNIASESAHGIELSSIPSVGQSVCWYVCVSVSLSRKCTVAKWLIGSGCCLGW